MLAAEDAPRPVIYLPLADRPASGGLAFDLGGSDIPKIRMQLTEPTSINGFSDVRAEPGSGGSLLAATSLNYTLSDRLELDASATLGRSEQPFMALGSIHCENGTLSALSYRASNCYFVDDRAALSSGVLALGSRYRITDQASASVRLFRTETAFDGGLAGIAGSLFPSALFNPGLIGGTPFDPLFAGMDPILGVQHVDTEMTGIDLEFQLGISTDRAGDMVLGLQLTRVLDGGLEGGFMNSPGITAWKVAEPFDSARLSFDWQRGAFSGGIQTYYRTPVDFLYRGNLDSVSTFDVHFTWRAPWNASLSVGASNVLNSGTEDRSGSENQLNDPFESVYGRIPYVRYKQDL